MRSFAFYGRDSTEDQQDPESSRAWQLARSRALIEPRDGTIVAEYFDIALSRSLPWKRRAQATALLTALRDPNRGFDAVVIGEPARAFYGNQFGLTFPVFTHYGVELWVPEVGGCVDPGSDAHDLVMSLYGGMSKGERNRIKIRVRAAMATQAATEGRFLGGRPPYGYRLADVGPHPNPGKAAVGQRRHALEPDPITAEFVRRIFAEYLAGRGIGAIADGLTRDGIPCPSAYDRARNRHRSGLAWSKGAIRAIVANPRYTGRQVWNRQRRDEVLIDVEDVALGHESRMRWNDATQWIWSAGQTHEALIDVDVFATVQAHLAAGAHRPVQRAPRATPRPYLLRGLVRCAICDRRMEGTWNHDRAHYRCRMRPDQAAANGIDHPPTAYLREDAVTGPVDEWISGLFAPAQLDSTADALTDAATRPDPAEDASLEAARRTVEDCDARLAKYRSVLDAHPDATVVGSWIAEVQVERLRAEVTIDRHRGRQRLTRTQIQTLVRGLGDMLAVLREAQPADKAEVYRQLGLHRRGQPDGGV